MPMGTSSCQWTPAGGRWAMGAHRQTRHPWPVHDWPAPPRVTCGQAARQPAPCYVPGRL